ncbi:MAG: hypothetical protein E6H57_00740 [Betaproteobacteria bacterium]|nr:MAG: hypothetical protein E6H57_00740 [Betaproteobacteria bacterium]
MLVLLLSGCSTVRLVYDNAETYLRWRAALYLDFEGAMAEELDERIAAFMAWHRAQALPKYAQIADEATRRFERRLQPADLVWGYDSIIAQARESLRAAAVQGAPLLDQLTPQQITHLERRLGEDNRRFQRENLRGSERERRRRRTERNVERLEDWVGRLSQAQLERVKQYSERAPLLDDLRDRDHKRIQAEFLAIVRAKEAKKRLPDWAANYDRGREPAYVAAVEASRKEYFAMALELDRSLSAQQRARAAGELRRYADDFRTLADERR